MDHGINVAKVSIFNISLSVCCAAGRGQGHAAIYPHLGPDCSSQQTRSFKLGGKGSPSEGSGGREGRQTSGRLSSKICLKSYRGALSWLEDFVEQVEGGCGKKTGR